MKMENWAGESMLLHISWYKCAIVSGDAHIFSNNNAQLLPTVKYINDPLSYIFFLWGK